MPKIGRTEMLSTVPCSKFRGAPFCKKKYKFQNKPIGIKLTRFGNSLLSRHFDKYDHENDCLLSGKVLLKLDEAMIWPYFVNKKKVVFYSQEDSAWFRVNGSKLERYIDII